MTLSASLTDRVGHRLEAIEQIRRSHASARPTRENPAWLHCHQDCEVLLREIDRLYRQLDSANRTITALTEKTKGGL